MQMIDTITAQLWAEFLETKPGTEFKPWDQMTELERAVMREIVAKELNPISRTSTGDK